MGNRNQTLLVFSHKEKRAKYYPIIARNEGGV